MKSGENWYESAAKKCLGTQCQMGNAKIAQRTCRMSHEMGNGTPTSAYQTMLPSRRMGVRTEDSTGAYGFEACASADADEVADGDGDGDCCCRGGADDDEEGDADRGDAA